jgi:hypothetical protein
VLPLSPDVRKIVVVGPLAESVAVLHGWPKSGRRGGVRLLLRRAMPVGPQAQSPPHLSPGAPLLVIWFLLTEA